LESIYERIIRQRSQVTAALLRMIGLGQDNVSDRSQARRDEGIDYPAPEAIAILQNIQTLAAGQAVETPVETGVPASVELENTAQADALGDLANELISEKPAAIESGLELAAVAAELSAEDELKSIVEESFLEESEEVLDNAEKLLKQWFEQRSDRSLLLQLQRAAHSIKGGARMIDNETVASIAYELETTFEQFAVYHFNSNAYDGLLQKTLAWLKQAIFQRDYSNVEQIQSGLAKIQYVDVTAQLPEHLAKTEHLAAVPSFEFIEGDGTEPPQMMGEWAHTGTGDTSNEMIRISADL